MLVGARSRIVALGLLAVLGGVACKKAGVAAGSVPNAFPVRVGGEGDATSSRRIGTIKPGDGQRLMFDLQKDPPLGSANIFSCWELPAPTLALGNAKCVDDNSKSFEVTANAVDFLCRTNPEFGVIRATVDQDVTGCSQYDVYAYAFEPSGALEVVGHK